MATAPAVMTLSVNNGLAANNSILCYQTWALKGDLDTVIKPGDTAQLSSNFDNTTHIPCMACYYDAKTKADDCTRQGSPAISLQFMRQKKWDNNAVHLTYYSGFTDAAGTWSQPLPATPPALYTLINYGNNVVTIKTANIPS